jgi:site-specific DNA-methyltransferase (adenine-specific)
MKSSRKSLSKTRSVALDEVIQGDCCEVVAAWADECVDLIYLDPPFLSQKRHRSTNRDRSRTFAFDDLWKSHHDYAKFIYERIGSLHRVLKSTGSLFFHCDRNAIHIARAVLDDIFGVENFRSEIIWMYRRWSNSKNGLLPSHQNILYYTKSDQYTFHQIYTDYSPATNVDQILQQRAKDAQGKSIYRRGRDGSVVSNGVKKGVPLGDVWDIPYLNPKAQERVGYPTQKPVLLLERIVELSTDPGDVVLDPFCGSGTTLVAAALNDRHFIGIDVSAEACELSRSRLDSPSKTESALVQAGRGTYANADLPLLQSLVGCDYVPVQRNRGIDAIINVTKLNSIVLVRIQRLGEALSETIRAIVQASKGKNASMLLVVQTQVPGEGRGECTLPQNVRVVEATSCAIKKVLQEL